MDFDTIMQPRREAVLKSIQQVPTEKLLAMESQIFPYFEHQWREPFEQFLKEHHGCTFYHADAGENIQIVYCPSANRGMWFIPKGGLGLLQERALKIMKDVVEHQK